MKRYVDRGGLAVSVAVFALSAVGGAAHARPVPLGQSTISVSYETGAGMQMYDGQRDYSGVGPISATNLGSAPNIAAFNSANEFGRRMNVSRSPLFSGVLHPDETAITHAFFKKLGNETADFFPGITEHSHVMVTISGIEFDQPVTLNQDTLLLHTLWNDQIRDLIPEYHHEHNIHTAAENFRDLDDFKDYGELVDHPHPNYVLADADIEWMIDGDGTAGDPLSITAMFPYHALMHLEEMHDPREVPQGLPAPHGFLEPFHFHIEYTVAAVPEPASLLLLAMGGLLAARRRRA